MHIPTFKECKGSDTAVVFIHGFMGSPNQLADLAEAVYAIGCTYKNILLPGHGGDMREFACAGYDDWQRHVQKEIEKIRSDYSKIFLVGHSMGGLLALNASTIRANNIAGAVLIATPLKVYTLAPKSVLLKIRLLLYPKSNEIKSSYLNACSVSQVKFPIYPQAVKTIREFYKLINRTQKHLGDVFVPIYMFHSKNDETTSYKSAALLYDGLCNTKRESFTLDKSWHAFYDGGEREIVKEKLVEFIWLYRESHLRNE